MKIILVTGGAGFIGSNFIRWMLRARSDVKIINFDALTYAGSMNNIRDFESSQRHTFIHGNICDKSKLEEVFRDHAIDQIIHFAAESHVDRSISGPDIFVNTNVVGTQALLDTALKYWRLNPNNNYSKKFKKDSMFVQISTDEVYGTLGKTGFFTEKTPLNPNSPYSASKAAGDLLALAYHRTYGLPVNITRCSNNYGPYQHTEKLIPMTIKQCRLDSKIPIYGDGSQIRDWIHVDDHCSAIAHVLEKGKAGEVYNIGANNEVRNIELVKSVLRIMNKSEDLIEFVQDRPGHDKRYAVDSTKMKNELNWEPEISFLKGLEDTIEWYLENQF